MVSVEYINNIKNPKNNSWDHIWCVNTSSVIYLQNMHGVRLATITKEDTTCSVSVENSKVFVFYPRMQIIKVYCPTKQQFLNEIQAPNEEWFNSIYVRGDKIYLFEKRFWRVHILTIHDFQITRVTFFRLQLLANKGKSIMVLVPKIFATDDEGNILYYSKEYGKIFLLKEDGSNYETNIVTEDNDAQIRYHCGKLYIYQPMFHSLEVFEPSK